MLRIENQAEPREAADVGDVLLVHALEFLVASHALGDHEIPHALHEVLAAGDFQCGDDRPVRLHDGFPDLGHGIEEQAVGTVEKPGVFDIGGEKCLGAEVGFLRLPHGGIPIRGEILFVEEKPDGFLKW